MSNDEMTVSELLILVAWFGSIIAMIVLAMWVFGLLP